MRQAHLAAGATLGLLALAGCGTASSSASAATAGRITATPSGPATAPPTSSQTLSQSRVLQVGLADAGRTIQVERGVVILVRLSEGVGGSGYVWSDPVSSDARVLHAHAPGPILEGNPFPDFLALTTGEATISSTGDLPCRQSSPPCQAPSRLFRVTVQVT